MARKVAKTKVTRSDPKGAGASSVVMCESSLLGIGRCRNPATETIEVRVLNPLKTPIWVLRHLCADCVVEYLETDMFYSRQAEGK